MLGSGGAEPEEGELVAGGLEVERLVLNPSASSAAVLTQDEKDLGVALVDIGAGTTDINLLQVVRLERERLS